jgi:hypothetical protein
MEGAHQVGREDPPQGFLVQGGVSAPSRRLTYTRSLRSRLVFSASLLRKSYATINIPLYQDFGITASAGWSALCMTRYEWVVFVEADSASGLGKALGGYALGSHSMNRFDARMDISHGVYGDVAGRTFCSSLLFLSLLYHRWRTPAFGHLDTWLRVQLHRDKVYRESTWIPMHLDTCWRNIEPTNTKMYFKVRLNKHHLS